MTVRAYVTAALAIAMPHGAVGAQALRVGENVLVSHTLGERPLTEPHLVAHPRDPNHLLGATIVAETADWTEGDCAAFLSLDGGKTWTAHRFQFKSCGDPWVGLSAQGVALFTALGTHAVAADTGMQLFAFWSRDGGRTWHDVPQSLGRGHDHQTVAVDTAGYFYVLSGQGRRDAEGKQRWSVYVGRGRPARPYVDVVQRFYPSNLNINAEGIALLSDGTVVISYTDFQRSVDGFRRGGMLERRRTWAMVSRDRGESFSIPLFVTETCGASWSFIASDTSQGSSRDRLYHVCPNREKTAIQVTRSADRAEQWSDPVAVEVAASKPNQRALPQIAVNRDGVVGVSWLDGRVDPAGRCYAPYFTASLDGGSTFLTPVRVASASSCPDTARNGAAQRRWPWGGDYYGLAAAPDGRFHVFWPDARGGRFQVWTAPVVVQRSP